MQVTIEVSEADAKLICGFASISRTLNEAHRLMLNCTVDVEEHVADDLTACADEVEHLEPMLNRLHQAVREVIWAAKLG